MLIASKLHRLLAVQLHLLHILIRESPDCKTVHCNMSETLQSLFGQSINSAETGQFWVSILLSMCLSFFNTVQVLQWFTRQKSTVMPIV